MASKLLPTLAQPSRNQRPALRSNNRLGPGRTGKFAGLWSEGGKREAFTLLDLIAAMAIAAILLVLALPNVDSFLRKAQEVRCMANMRSITVGLGGYLQDHGNVWPQGPAPTAGAVWESYWLTVLQPYGIVEKTWLCPTILARLGPEAAQVHYAPTMFPPTPGIANRWATQPWLIERGPGHGQGALICFPDGSIKSFDKVLAEQGLP